MEAKMNDTPRDDGSESVIRELHETLGINPDHATRLCIPIAMDVVTHVRALCPQMPGHGLELCVYHSMLHALDAHEGARAAGVCGTPGDPIALELAEASRRQNLEKLDRMGISASDAQWIINLAKFLLNRLPRQVMYAASQAKLRPPTADVGRSIVRGAVTAALRFMEQVTELAARKGPAGETTCDPIQPSTGGTDPAPTPTPPPPSS